jgi:hypothetical protein
MLKQVLVILEGLWDFVTGSKTFCSFGITVTASDQFNSPVKATEESSIASDITTPGNG